MKVRDLICALSDFDLDMDVRCSVDCDVKKELHLRQRSVLGNSCRGVSLFENKAVLLFDLESINFKADEDEYS